MRLKFEEAKINIILIISFMMLLFTLCLVLYSDVFQKFTNISINTNYTLNGGKDDLSQKLQKIIPYADVTSPKYLTAYQAEKSNLTNIHNDILLTMAGQALNFTNLDSSHIQSFLSNNYGRNYFIVYNSFNVNGQDNCTFNEDLKIYSCSKQKLNNILYQAKRNIINITISDLITLKENVLFYSQETIDNLDIYKIYQDGTYQNVLKAFTNQDLEITNMNLETYLTTYNDYSIEYESIFQVEENNHYIWLETKKI